LPFSIAEEVARIFLVKIIPGSPAQPGAPKRVQDCDTNGCMVSGCTLISPVPELVLIDVLREKQRSLLAGLQEEGRDPKHFVATRLPHQREIYPK
jgi:hypothetical protein